MRNLIQGENDGWPPRLTQLLPSFFRKHIRTLGLFMPHLLLNQSHFVRLEFCWDEQGAQLLQILIYLADAVRANLACALDLGSLLFLTFLGHYTGTLYTVLHSKAICLFVAETGFILRRGVVDSVAGLVFRLALRCCERLIGVRPFQLLLLFLLAWLLYLLLHFSYFHYWGRYAFGLGHEHLFEPFLLLCGERVGPKRRAKPCFVLLNRARKCNVFLVRAGQEAAIHCHVEI